MKLDHLALIMDGNRRWARMRTLKSLAGHDKGVEALKNITRAVAGYNIGYFTVFAFSAENWKRSDAEVSGLIGLMQRFCKKEIDRLVAENVRLFIIGDKTAFDTELQGLFVRAEERTSACTGLTLSVAVNYGGQQDIEQAAEAMRRAEHSANAPKKPFSSYLYTASLPPVDMLVRTGGEQRLSNFLLWNISYAELYFTETFWPDFDADDLKDAVNCYYNRKRRFGGDDHLAGDDISPLKTEKSA